MMTRLFLSILFASTLVAAPELEEFASSESCQVAALMHPEDQLIHGCISPVSGQLSLRHVDLVAKAVEPIVLSRTYIAPFLRSAYAQEEARDKEQFISILHKSYRGWVFFPHIHLFAEPSQGEMRITDARGVTVDAMVTEGKFFIKNSDGMHNASGGSPTGSRDMRNMRAHWEEGDGKIVVRSPEGKRGYYKKKKHLPRREHSYLYVLEKEILPNGKIVRYSYGPEEQLIRVESCDPQERYVYAVLEIEPVAEGYRFTSSDHQSASYQYTTKEVSYQILEESAALSANLHSFGLCSTTESPEMLLVKKSDKKKKKKEKDRTPKSRKKERKKDSRAKRRSGKKGKVFRDFAEPIEIPLSPYDKEDDEVPILPAPYLAPEPMWRTVTLRTPLFLTAVESPLHPQARFDYGPRLQLCNQWVQSRMLFECPYEEQHNQLSIKKLLLPSGDATEPSVAEELLYDPPIARQKEGRTVVNHADGTSTHYQIGSDYLIHTIVHHGKEGRVQRKKKFHWSSDHMLLALEVEDGSGKLLEKTSYSYDRFGNPIQETLTGDLNGNGSEESYRIVREFSTDGLHLLMREEREDGRVQTCHYLPGTDLLVAKYVGSREKIYERTFFEYDDCYNLTCTIRDDGDSFDQESAHGVTERLFTRYRLRQQQPFLHMPEWVEEGYFDGDAEVLLRKKKLLYDRHGNVTKEEIYDAEGVFMHRTEPSLAADRGDRAAHSCPRETASHNARGAPAEILYPNGSSEFFTYYKNGVVKSHRDREGLTNHYTYDVMGRLLSKTYAAQNQVCAEETYVYNSAHLIAETDKEGYVTHYSYDRAGRKIREERSGRAKSWVYDSLGRVNTLIQHNDGNSLYTHFTYDPLDRVVEETKKDVNGTLLARIVYDYEEKSSQFHAPRDGQVIKNERLSPSWAILSLSEETYDSHGNLLLHKDFIYENGHYFRSENTEYHYNNSHLVEAFVRAAGTSSERITRFTYTPSGRLRTKTLPDGTILSYTYDSLGFLASVTSSDGKIQQSFVHDRLGRLVRATDGSISIERELDPFGQVLEERIGAQVSIRKTYDHLGRTLTLQLPDRSELRYSYDPLYLRAVSRYSASQELLYTHQYTDYDEQGLLTAERLIGACGDVEYLYDASWKKTGIKSRYFTQECHFDLSGNLSSMLLNQAMKTYAYDGLSQLIRETSPFGNHAYQFDSHYNRTEKDAGHDKTNNLDELVQCKKMTFFYDLNGNLIAKKSPTKTVDMGYDPLNRLTDAITGVQHIACTYDPLNRRVSKNVLSDERHRITQYFYDGNDELGAMDESGHIHQLRVPGLNGQAVALELYGNVYVPLTDCQGNIHCLIDPESQEIVREYDYTAFGEHNGTSGVKRIFNPWRYAAKRWDPELNLIYFGHRYYDPRMGRWITPDPEEFSHSTNLYHYRYNNPFVGE